MYFIIPGGAAHGSDQDVLHFWEDQLGKQHVLQLPDPNDTAESIAMTIGLNEGVIGLDEAQQHLGSRGRIGTALDRLLRVISGVFAGKSSTAARTNIGKRQL